uniref:G-protein coupled receptors family 1 profile domain-containing protein n=1 Tax=Plectus sambesii TaxID=2011161 RepID=A0A914W040_9BILA
MANNSTSSSIDTIFSVIIYGQVIAPALGVLINLLVLIIGTFRVKGSYKHYLSNLAVIDGLFGLGTMLVTIDHHFRWLIVLPQSVAVVATFFCFVSIPLMSVALVPISLDRYLKMCRQTRLPRFLIPPVVCVIFDLLPAVVMAVVNLLGFNQLADKLYLMVIPVLALLIVLACNVAIFVFVSRHMALVASLENRKRLMETKQLARATCIQAVSPLLMQLPPLLGIYSLLATGKDTNGGHSFYWELANIFWLIILFNPFVDGLVTLFIVRTYRETLSKCGREQIRSSDERSTRLAASGGQVTQAELKPLKSLAEVE